MKGVDPSHTFFAGEIICDAVFFDPVHNAIDWYIPMIKNDCFVMIRLKQVLITSLKIKSIDETNMIPNTCNKKQATSLDAMKIDDSM